MDNDRAGWVSVDNIWNGYKRRLKLRFANYSGIDAKDVGDMTDGEIRQAVETARPIPLRSA